MCEITSDADLDRNNELSTCRDALERGSKKGIHWNRTIILGGIYGVTDDKFRTPLGTQSGVSIHSFIHYSLCDKLLPNKILSMLIDLLFGIFFGQVFQSLWRRYRISRKSIAKRTCAAVLVSLALIVGIFLALLVMPLSMIIGLWVNPWLIVLGLFIHSFLEAINDHHARSSVSNSWWKRFFGVCADGGDKVFCSPSADNVVYWTRLSLQYIVVLWGIYKMTSELIFDK